MKTFFNAANFIVLLALVAGCGQEKLGGGSRSIVAGNTAKEAVYGIREGRTLGFVIFTDIPGKGTVTSADSTWTGYIKPTEGPTVVYEGSADRFDINGTEYMFAHGRVFLVSTQEGKVSASQLNIPIRDANYEAEVGRLAELEEVQEFLNK